MARETINKNVVIGVDVKRLAKARKDLNNLNTALVTNRKSTSGLAKSTGELDRNLKGTAQITSNTTKAFAKQSQGLGGLVRAYATVAANVFALTAAYTALRRAANIEKIIEAQGVVATQTGVSLRGMSNAIREVTGNAVSMEQALRTASTATSAGFNVEQIETLTSVARGASLALGRDLPDSIDRLTRGVIKLEPELLDELGIMVRLDEAVRSYAASAGKAVSDVTFFERRQAFANAVLEQGAEKFGEVAEAIDVNQFDVLSSKVADALKAVGGFLNTVLTPFLDLINNNSAALLGFVSILVTSIASKAIPALTDFATEAQIAIEQSAIVQEETIRRIEDQQTALLRSQNKQIFDQINNARTLAETKSKLAEDTIRGASRELNLRKSLGDATAEQIQTDRELRKQIVGTTQQTIGRLEEQIRKTKDPAVVKRLQERINLNKQVASSVRSVTTAISQEERATLGLAEARSKADFQRDPTIVRAQIAATRAQVQATRAQAVQNIQATVTTRGLSFALKDLAVTTRATTASAIAPYTGAMGAASRATGVLAGGMFFLKGATLAISTAISAALGPIFAIIAAASILVPLLKFAGESAGILSSNTRDLEEAISTTTENLENFNSALDRLDSLSTGLDTTIEKFEVLTNLTATAVGDIVKLSSGFKEANFGLFGGNEEETQSAVVASLKNIREIAKETQNIDQFNSILEELGIQSIEAFSALDAESDAFANALKRLASEDAKTLFTELGGAVAFTGEKFTEVREAAIEFNKEVTSFLEKGKNKTELDPLIEQLNIISNNFDVTSGSAKNLLAQVDAINRLGISAPVIFDEGTLNRIERREALVERYRQKLEEAIEAAERSGSVNEVEAQGIARLTFQYEQANIRLNELLVSANASVAAFEAYRQKLLETQNELRTLESRLGRVTQLQEDLNSATGVTNVSLLKEQNQLELAVLDTRRQVLLTQKNLVGATDEQVKRAEAALTLLSQEEATLRRQQQLKVSIAEVEQSFRQAEIVGLTDVQALEKQREITELTLRSLLADRPELLSQELEILRQQTENARARLEFGQQLLALEAQADRSGGAAERATQQLEAEKERFAISKQIAILTQNLNAAEINALERREQALENGLDIQKAEQKITAALLKQKIALAKVENAIATGNADDIQTAAIALSQANLALTLAEGEKKALDDRIDAENELTEILKKRADLAVEVEQLERAAEVSRNLGDLFGNEVANGIGDAIDQMAVFLEQLQRAGEDGQFSLQELGGLAGTAAQGFSILADSMEQGTSEQKAFTAAAGALQLAQTALAIVEGVNAVIFQLGSGDPYTAIPRAIAVAGMVSSLLTSIGAGSVSVSGANAGPTLEEEIEDRRISQARGVLESDEEADSLIEGVDTLVDVNFDLLSQGEQVILELKQIQNVFTGAATEITKSLQRNFGVRGAFDINDIVDLVDQGAFNITSGQGRIRGDISDILDAGILFDPASWGQIAGGQLSAQLFADFETERVDSPGFFGRLLGEQDEVITDQISVQFGPDSVDQQILDIFAEGIVDIANSAIDIATQLGFDPTLLQERLESFVLQSYNLSLADLDPEEQAEAIANFFSVVADDIVSTIVPGIESFRRAGEETFETLTRLFSVQQVFNEGLALLGLTMDDIFIPSLEDADALLRGLATTQFTLGDPQENTQDLLRSLNEGQSGLGEGLHNFNETFTRGTGQLVEDIEFSAAELEEALTLLRLEFQQIVVDELGLEDAAQLQEFFQTFAQGIFTESELLGRALDSAQIRLVNGISQLSADLQASLPENLDVNSFRDFFLNADLSNPEDFAAALRLGTVVGQIAQIRDQIEEVFSGIFTDLENNRREAESLFADLVDATGRAGIEFTGDINDLVTRLRNIDPEDLTPELLAAIEASSGLLEVLAELDPTFRSITAAVEDLQGSVLDAATTFQSLRGPNVGDDSEAAARRLQSIFGQFGGSESGFLTLVDQVFRLGETGRISAQEIDILNEGVGLLAERAQNAFDRIGSAVSDLDATLANIRNTMSNLEDTILSAGGTITLEIGGIQRSFTGLSGAAELAALRLDDARANFDAVADNVFLRAQATDALVQAILDDMNARIALAQQRAQQAAARAQAAVQAQNEAINEQIDLLSGLRDFAEDIKDFVLNIRLDENLSIFTPGERTEIAGNAFEEALTGVTGIDTSQLGFEDAISIFENLDPENLPQGFDANEAQRDVLANARRFLELARLQFGSTDEFENIFNDVVGRLDALGLSLGDVDIPPPPPETTEFYNSNLGVNSEILGIQEDAFDQLGQLEDETERVRNAMREVELRALEGNLIGEDGNLNLAGIEGLTDEELDVLRNEIGPELVSLARLSEIAINTDMLNDLVDKNTFRDATIRGDGSIKGFLGRKLNAITGFESGNGANLGQVRQSIDIGSFEIREAIQQQTAALLAGNLTGGGVGENLNNTGFGDVVSIPSQTTDGGGPLLLVSSGDSGVIKQKLNDQEREEMVQLVVEAVQASSESTNRELTDSLDDLGGRIEAAVQVIASER